jgi:serine/threonine protein kinase
MDPKLRKKAGDTVILKEVFVKGKASEDVFYQEVGIMVMLSTFPNFCEIVGYTENPMALVLKNYPNGSLNSWLKENIWGTGVMIKILKEISEALNTMHSHYLAHCDVKPQNVLVEVANVIPTCFITDFGITQILSENIVASRSFRIISLKGLSVNYASPESLKCFRLKNYSGSDFKKYDVYSLSCITYELLSRRTPWS